MEYEKANTKFTEWFTGIKDKSVTGKNAIMIKQKLMVLASRYGIWELNGERFEVIADIEKGKYKVVSSSGDCTFHLSKMIGTLIEII